ALPLTSRAGLVDRLVRSMASAADAGEADGVLLSALEREQEVLRRQQVPQERIDDRLIELARAVRARLWSEILLRPGRPGGSTA
ncbi:MAG: DUF6074 family protein, partial [Xanthobacteraceae bacterium]